jgi:glycosyltransferase involved in cell wall biosynthesis
MADQSQVRWPSLAVVVPALNDAVPLEATLTSLLTQSVPADCVLVVDGDWRGGATAAAQARGARVLVVPDRGRGGQIAAGVAAVVEDIVVIGHADMVFPATALEAIRRRLAADPSCPGGCLGHRFDSPRWQYRVMEWLDRRRARRGNSYGDQAQFFRRASLERVGGFPDQPMMEDVELARRLKELGRPVCLDLPVIVSPRRFERLGWWRAVWANWTLRRAYRRRGLAACEEIYERYYGTGVGAAQR